MLCVYHTAKTDDHGTEYFIYEPILLKKLNGALVVPETYHVAALFAWVTSAQTTYKSSLVLSPHHRHQEKFEYTEDSNIT